MNDAEETEPESGKPSPGYPPEWETRIMTLCDRFPEESRQNIIKELRESDGHAGHAAAALMRTMGGWTADAGGGKDETDAPIRWEYYQHKRNRWVPYDQDSNDQIQAAYQKYQADDSRHNEEIEITIGRRHKYTINLKDLSSTSHGDRHGHNKDRTEIYRVEKDTGAD